MQFFSIANETRQIISEYRNLLRGCKERLQKSDIRNVRLAFDMASEAHEGMRRKSGEPYILHPLAVARIVSEEIGLGPTAVICSLLHDVVEDTELTLEDIEREFGKNVAEIIDGLTKISGVLDASGNIQAENFRKILLTLAKDMRVVLIKLADRLHNMRTMDSMPRHKQLKIASETLYIYAPLAHRLGLYALKSELEDLAMKYTEPGTYKMIAQKLKDTKKERNKYIAEFINPIMEDLAKKGFKFRIFGRPKGIHSIWNKMKRQNVTFEQVYDKFAIRIIIDSAADHEKADCWRAYSTITDHYRPNPDRLRDWISTPKANGYEALHTTVMGPGGKWVEVQIRTERMNEIAEKGYAAHWKYKEDDAEETDNDTTLDEWLQHVRELLENSTTNTHDFLNEFKLNLFSDEMYIFTPKGDLKILPSNATVLDFAYDIHTDIGHTCIGAKVNHKLVPSSHRLRNGDQVEVLTSQKQEPTEEWLRYVMTAKAKSRITDALKTQRKEIVERGKERLEKQLLRKKITINSSNLKILLDFYKMPDQIDLYYNIGIGQINIEDIKGLDRDGDKLIIQQQELGEQEQLEASIKKALVTNANTLMFGARAGQIDYNLARCCRPIPGDEVFGFVNKADQIEIHKTDCPKAIKIISQYGYKIVKTKWTKEHKIAFLIGLKMTGVDDVGIVYKLTKIISEKLKVNIQSISIDSKDGVFEGVIKVYVDDTKHLANLKKKLLKVKGILTVDRLEEDMDKLNPVFDHAN